MRKLATAAIICAALSGGSAQAQTMTAAQVLGGSRWAQLGFETDLSKISEAEIEAAHKRACATPNLAFVGQGDQLTELNYVVDPPSPTAYAKARVITREDKTLVLAFYSAGGTKPDTGYLLSRGGTLMSVPSKMFGTWHYARCADPNRSPESAVPPARRR